MLKAALNPFGIILLLASLVLAGLVLFVLDRWSGQALWIVLLGLLGYAASIAVFHLTTAVQEHPIDSSDAELDPPKDEIGEPDSLVLRPLVHEGLRRLNNPNRLSQCRLASLLPATLASVVSQAKSNGTPGELAPLDKAQALRKVLIAAIEQLKPPGELTGLGATQAHQYYILHEQYVLGRVVANVAVRHDIPEGTYFKWQSAAVSVVARQLQNQEELLGGGEAKTTETG